MLNAFEITQLHDDATLRWHLDPLPPPADVDPNPLAELALAHHRANFDLWHEEDKAREPGATDAQITAVKHAIDVLNQRRNDLVEWMLTAPPPQRPIANAISPASPYSTSSALT